MSTVEDFENAPVGAIATHRTTGSRAMKMDNTRKRWITPHGLYWSDVEMVYWNYTLEPSAPTSAREALALAWDLAHEVREGRVIPKGTQILMLHDSGLKEVTTQNDVVVRPHIAPITRTLEPLPEPEPDWLDAPAVLAATSMCPDRKVWTPESGGVWKCACCRDERHWSELVDVIPLYPKETEA